MATTNRLGREPQFGDTSFSMRGPLPAVSPPPSAPAPQAMPAGQGGMGGLQVPDKLEYFRQRLYALSGTPMVKPRETLRQIEQDYRALVTQAVAAKRLELDQLKGQQTETNRQAQRGIARRGADRADMAETRMQDTAGAATTLARDKYDREGNLGFQAELANATRDDPLLNLARLLSEGTSDSLFGSPESREQARLRELATDYLTEKMETGLADIRRPKAAARLKTARERKPRDLSTTNASPEQPPRSTTTLPTAGGRRAKRPLKADFGAGATTQPSQPTVPVILPDGRTGTIPADRLEAFLQAFPGAKVAK